MQVYCHQCGKEIPAQNIDFERRLATCPNCNTLLNISNQLVLSEPEWPNPLFPQGLAVTRQNDELVITRRWFRGHHLGLLIFALFWNGVLLVEAFAFLSWGYFLLPHTWIGLGILYYVLTGLFNITVITVNKKQLSVRHRPFPAFGHKKVDVSTIDQLYAKEKQHRNKGGVNYSYEVHALIQNKPTTLIKGLDSPLQALYLEEEIERLLAIEDKWVQGELGVKEAANWSSWRNVAEANNLTFIPSKLAEGTRIQGHYQGYDLGIIILREGQKRDGRLLTRLTFTRPTPLTAETEPTLTLKQALLRFDQLPARLLEGPELKIEGEAHKLVFELPEIITKARHLQYLINAGCELLDLYTQLLKIGAEAIPALQPLMADRNNIFRSLISSLVQDIGTITLSLRLRLSQLLCRQCLRRFTAHQVETSWLRAMTYYGCRACQRSVNPFLADQVIAVLDSRMAEKTSQQDQTLRVNWLEHRQLFDFEAVEIIHAADEDIERFAVQVGNDTDEQRRDHYQTMPCLVAPGCPLSANSHRILERTFKLVTTAGG
jgi:hypothetical protein